MGYLVPLPPGQTPFSAYLFSLHSIVNLPWDHAIVNGVMTLRACVCEGVHPVGSTSCKPCQDLKLNTLLEGIIMRMSQGVHENVKYAYHGFVGMVEILPKKKTCK